MEQNKAQDELVIGRCESPVSSICLRPGDLGYDQAPYEIVIIPVTYPLLRLAPFQIIQERQPKQEG